MGIVAPMGRAVGMLRSCRVPIGQDEAGRGNDIGLTLGVDLAVDVELDAPALV
jgi:hypothetical protein